MVLLAGLLFLSPEARDLQLKCEKHAALLGGFTQRVDRCLEKARPLKTSSNTLIVKQEAINAVFHGLSYDQIGILQSIYDDEVRLIETYSSYNERRQHKARIAIRCQILNAYNTIALKNIPIARNTIACSSSQQLPHIIGS